MVYFNNPILGDDGIELLTEDGDTLIVGYQEGIRVRSSIDTELLLRSPIDKVLTIKSPIEETMRILS